MCLSAGGSPWGSTTLRLLLRETPLGSFFLLWGWADVRVERLYFVLAWWFSGCGMLCSYNVSLMVERGCMPCSYFVGRAIKRVFLR